MKYRYLILTFLYCAAIFYVSHQPVPPGPEGVPHLDKLFHMLAYGGLTALVSVGLRRSRKEVHSTVQFLGPVAFAFFFGFTDELHQYFVPQRSFDSLDLVANGVGALATNYILCRFVWGVPVERHPLR